MRNFRVLSKSICYILSIMLLVLLFSQTWLLNVVWAGSGQRMFDEAGLFSESEIEEFEEKISDYQKKMGVDVVVVTTSDARGKTAQDYADDFYDENEFGRGKEANGVLFLIDMDNRELTLSTSGIMIRFLTDRRVEKILDDVYEGASVNNFVDSVNRFLEDIMMYYKQGIESGQYNYNTETGEISVYRSIRWYELLLAIGVAGFVALTACLNIIRQYGMKKERQQAAKFQQSYRADCNFVFHNRTDKLLNKHVTSRIIPKNNHSSSSGKSGGGSSAGRSSTHTSSSGRSHGGGSRKF